MRIRQFHSWNVSPDEAIRIQKRLQAMVEIGGPLRPSEVKKIGAADLSYSKRDNLIYSVVMIFSFPQLNLLEEKHASFPVTFPYVPGLLAFREGPALIKAFEQITNNPDAVLFDGQGIAHPRRIGIATHIGILLDKPSIGVAKTVLAGEYQEPGKSLGAYSPLMKDGDQIGVVLRTKSKVRPIFVSVGHKINLSTAIDIVLACCKGYRLPEPIRQAHIFSNHLRAQSSN